MGMQIHDFLKLPVGFIALFLIHLIPALIYRDGTRLGTIVEAHTATGTAFALITARVIAMRIESLCQLQHLYRTGFHAETTAFTFLGIDQYMSSRFCRAHKFLHMLGF